MHPVLAAALDRNGGVFATCDAVAAGVPRTSIPPLLRSGAWRRLRYGVYTTGEIHQRHAADGTLHELDCAAVVLRLGRPAVVSHTSAARLHGLVLPAEPPTGVWVSDPGQFRVGKGYRVLEAPLPPEVVETRGALRVTTLPRTLADVGRAWEVVDTVVAVDDALADGRLTRADLTAAALAQTHWVGAGKASTAFGLAEVGAHSPHETRTRMRFLAAGLPAPLLQVAVWRGGRLVAVLDMYWPEHGVFCSCDGKVKLLDPWGGRTPAEAAWREKSQHDELVDIGLRGVHVKPVDTHAAWPEKVARVERLFAAPRPELAPGVRIVQHNGGLRLPIRPLRSA